VSEPVHRVINRGEELQSKAESSTRSVGDGAGSSSRRPRDSEEGVGGGVGGGQPQKYTRRAGKKYERKEEKKGKGGQEGVGRMISLKGLKIKKVMVRGDRYIPWWRKCDRGKTGKGGNIKTADGIGE